MSRDNKYQLRLMGAFRLISPNGDRIHVASKKTIALLGMLATAEAGERTRGWLQEKLWGSRDPPQAQSSLRREVYSIRSLTSTGTELIQSDSQVVRINFDLVDVDVRSGDFERPSEFLEGINIAGAETFAEWLRETRARLHDLVPTAGAPALSEHGSEAAEGSPTSLTLTLHPLQVDLREPDLPDYALLAGQIIVERLVQSRWFRIAVHHPEPSDNGQGKAGTQAIYRSPHYHLTGRLAGGSPERRLSLHLNYQPDDEMLWSETTTLPEDIRSPEFSRAIQRLANRVILVVVQRETQRALATPFKELDVEQLTWRARYFLQYANISGLAEARICIDAGLARRPYSPELIILDGYHRFMICRQEGSIARQYDYLRRLAQRCIDADEMDSRGPVLASILELAAGDIHLALSHARKAVQISPSYIGAQEQLGITYTLLGWLDEAVASLELALELSPRDWREFHVLTYLALAYDLRGQHTDAIDLCNRAINGRPDHLLSRLVKIDALVQTGLVESAAAEYSSIPEVSRCKLDALLAMMRFRNPEFQQRLGRSVSTAAARAKCRHIDAEVSDR